MTLVYPRMYPISYNTGLSQDVSYNTGLSVNRLVNGDKSLTPAHFIYCITCAYDEMLLFCPPFCCFILK